jgi:hypothetical protein
MHGERGTLDVLRCLGVVRKFAERVKDEVHSFFNIFSIYGLMEARASGLWTFCSERSYKQ